MTKHEDGATLNGVALTELLDCKICGKPPLRGGVVFMGHHIECPRCGIAYPFPPARDANEAAKLWNEAQSND